MKQSDIVEFNLMCEKTKEALPPGPWMHEPNRVEFKYVGLDCMLIRNPVMFNWCGYVGLKKDHPNFGKHYNDPENEDLRVHGGLTYADYCHGRVCHIADVKEGETFWLGFDCAHGGDFMPIAETNPHMKTLNKDYLGREGIYRDVEYAKKETMDLAEQLSTKFR